MIEERVSRTTALPVGTSILGGQYCVLQLLHQRPRVHLYLGKRLAPRNEMITYDVFVAIRELVLTGLSPQTCVEVEQAAFEEFVSPLVTCSPRLPGVVDRVLVEDGRHYLVTYLNGSKRGLRSATQHVTLAQLLLRWREWPSWLEMETALTWGIQLCCIVARLHRAGVVLGDLDPTTVLVDGEGLADWSPLLLASWPPAPQCWPHYATTAVERYQQIFPCARADTANAFAAPEMLIGTGDARADVYSLGAILYLLLTRYAPIAAAHRLRKANEAVPPESRDSLNSLELIPPQRLNRQLPARLSEILVRALEIEPERRYASAFELGEAIGEVLSGRAVQPLPSGMGRQGALLVWGRR